MIWSWIVKFNGILARDKSGFILQSSQKIYRLELPRVPVDCLERQVIIEGIIAGKDIIIVDGISINSDYPKAASL